MLSLVKKAETVNKQPVKESFTLLDYGYFGLIIAIVCIVIVSGLKLYHKNDTLQSIVAERPRLEQQLASAKAEKPKVVIQEKKEKLLNARKAGQELVDAQKVFVLKFLPSDKPLADDFDKQYKLAESKVKEYLAANNKEFLSNPWLRNPLWDLHMETIVNFATNDAPVIFTMTGTSGKLMGFVTGEFDGQSFKNVVVRYTQDGLRDSVDNGGK